MIRGYGMNTVTEPTTPGTKAQSVKPAKRHIGKIIIIVVLVLLVGAATGVAGYWWRDMSAKTADKQKADQIATLQQNKTTLEKQLAAEKAKNAVAATPAVTPCSVQAPNATTTANIEASITSGNTAALGGYMAASVNVVFAAADALAPETPDQAIANITNFITSNTSAWDYNFSLPAATLNVYRNGSYKQYIPSTAIVGKATNGHVIAFSFDCNAKIATVFMAASDALLQ